LVRPSDRIGEITCDTDVTKLLSEEAVARLREDCKYERFVMENYLDDPLAEAAERFWRSREWEVARESLPRPPGRAIDLGAGRGMASYALARDGWEVTALEPDPSDLVGTGAIRELARRSGLPIRIVEGRGESTDLADGSADVVYSRQVLHHVADLGALCREIARVLKRGGRYLATREHVISRSEDREAFLRKHVLHQLRGGENAYRVEEYVAAMKGSGLDVVRILGSMDSALNIYPMSQAAWRKRCCAPLFRVLGYKLTLTLVSPGWWGGRLALRRLARYASARDVTPGRLCSFVAVRV